MLELALIILVPLGMAAFGLSLLVNALESIKKSTDEWKRLK